MGRVTIFSISTCPHCRAAKTLLTSKGVKYVDVDLTKHPERRKPLEELTGLATVPQIFFNDVLIGGNSDLQKLESDGVLDDRLRELDATDVPDSAPELPDSDSEESATTTMSDVYCDIPLNDEQTRIVDRLQGQAGLLVKSHRSGLRTHNRCFSGKDIVSWISDHECGGARDTAVAIAASIFQANIFNTVEDTSNDSEFADDATLYRFQQDEEPSVLNEIRIFDCSPRSANTVGEEIRVRIMNLYGKFLSNDGKEVDYEGMRNSAEFGKYVSAICELQKLNIEELTREETLAFFINIYNALVIHATIKVGSPTSIRIRRKFFSKYKYNIGGYAYSLQDIENGILRGNKRAPYSLSRPFPSADPRKAFKISGGDPRIHFALVCGARSCPIIQLYTPSDVDEALTSATKSFLDADLDFVTVGSKVEFSVSKILYWYKADFGGSDAKVLEFVSRYLRDDEKRKVILDSLERKNFRVKYKAYDWGSNAKEE